MGRGQCAPYVVGAKRSGLNSAELHKSAIQTRIESDARLPSIRRRLFEVFSGECVSSRRKRDPRLTVDLCQKQAPRRRQSEVHRRGDIALRGIRTGMSLLPCLWAATV